MYLSTVTLNLASLNALH